MQVAGKEQQLLEEIDFLFFNLVKIGSALL
jgi:hypothetical protein